MLLILRKLRRDDGGAAMASVLGLILVGVLLSTLIMSSVIGSFSTTTSTRASVQAQAAARAGIAQAFVGLQTAGSCLANGGVYTSNTAPRFRATIWYGAARGCPTGSGEVRIIATGYADSKGVAGNTFGDVAYLEATYLISSNNATGSAIYVYNGGNINALSVLAGSETSGDIRIPTGDFSCSTGSVVEGSVIVAAGNATLNNSCIIKGNLHVSGSVTLNNTVQILGDVIAAGGGVSIGAPVVVSGNVYAKGAVNIYGTVKKSVEATGAATLQSGSKITGDVKAGGYVEANGTVDGSVTSPGGGTMSQSGGWIKGSLTLGGSFTRMEGTARVSGNVSAAGTGELTLTPNNQHIGGTLAVGGDINTWNYSGDNNNANKATYMRSAGSGPMVVGAISYRQTGLPVPAVPTPKAAPTVPDWVDVGYVPADWTAAGYQILTWPNPSKCQLGSWDSDDPGGSLYSFWNQVRNLTVPTVIDARACSQLDFCNCGNIELKLKTDVAFISKSFSIGKLQVKSFDSTPHKASFIVPDGQPTTPGRHCNNGAGNINIYGTSVISSPISAIAYTPCQISINNASGWRGQFYGGTFTMSSSDALTYVPVGIPGVNLDGLVGGAELGGLGSAVSIRNVSGNGE